MTEEELLAKVRELNEDADVDGFIVQLPLPKHISEQKVIETSGALHQEGMRKFNILFYFWKKVQSVPYFPIQDSLPDISNAKSFAVIS